MNYGGITERYTEDVMIDGLVMYWTKQSNWLLICGIMPWNWMNSDIWTAYVMADRELSALRNYKASQ